jgi:hypothetical protein
MSVATLEAKALRHWKKWLPKKVAALRAEGKLEEAVRGAALLAQNEIEHLMKYRGYQEHEAEEVALSQFVLLPPEGDGLADWERKELAALDREYRKNPPVGR